MRRHIVSLDPFIVIHWNMLGVWFGWFYDYYAAITCFLVIVRRTLVNDPYVMHARAKQVDPDGKIVFYGDVVSSVADFVGKAIDLDVAALGPGKRAHRYSALIVDGTVTWSFEFQDVLRLGVPITKGVMEKTSESLLKQRFAVKARKLRF